MFIISSAIRSALNWYHGTYTVNTEDAQTALEAPPIGMGYYQGDANQVLDMMYSGPNGLELRTHMYAATVFPKDYKPFDEEKPHLSAKELWTIEQGRFQHQLDLFSKHPILGPMCDGLIAKQLERTPLPTDSETGEPIPITPKIAAIAIKKALNYEAKVAGTDISELSLTTRASIDAALERIQEGRDTALTTFFGYLLGVISNEAFNAIFADDSLSAAEKAMAIRTWLAENQETLNAVDTIELGSRDLTSIPPEISYFSQLKQLALHYNQITAIPDSLGQLAQLEVLYLNFNQITTLPDSFGNLTKLYMLNLSINQISSIPDSLAKLAQLKELHLTYNQISSIPDSLAKLAQLKFLILDHNRISSIPDSLAQLAQLKSLVLADNQISSIPDSLGQLAPLKGLSLQNNQISAIPDSLGQLAKLETLSLKNNQISAIPNSLGQLAKLEVLSLQDNQISAIPESLGQLAKLETLSLKNNQISAIPEALKRIPIWQDQDYLDGNPIAQ